MIKFVLGLFGFAVLLCAWIVIDPEAWKAPATGSATGPDTAPARAAEAAPTPVVVPVEEAVQVTRSAVAPSIDMRNIVRVVEEPSIQIADQTLAATAAGVLAGLGIEAKHIDDAGPGDAMATITTGVLANLQNVTGAGDATTRVQSPLETLIIQALSEGQTDDAIDAAVNEAALAGRLAVPDVLVTADGRVDTDVLLASIVSEARVSAGQSPTAEPVGPAGGEGVEVRVVQRADETEQYRFYTVGAGDSLGAIAIKFYGDARFYAAIFDANRAILSSPDRIRTGQRLVIPEV